MLLWNKNIFLQTDLGQFVGGTRNSNTIYIPSNVDSFWYKYNKMFFARSCISILYFIFRFDKIILVIIIMKYSY